MVYHIMPSSIVLLKSYTQAVLLLILSLPNFSAMCIFPQGQVWEVAEWVAQSGWVVIVEMETESPAVKSRYTTTCKAQEVGEYRWKLWSCLVPTL